MKIPTSTYLLCCLVSITITSTSFAWPNDVFPSPWHRGQSGTAYAVWNQWDRFADTMRPDEFAAYPFWPVPPSASAGANANFLPAYMQRTNIINLPPYSQLTFAIPNPFHSQKIGVWLELTYLPFNIDVLSPSFDLELLDASPNTAITATISTFTGQHRDNWFTQAYYFEIQPNTLDNIIQINFTYLGIDSLRYPLYLDRLSFDTLWMPEASTIVLFCLGFSYLFYRKK